MRQHLGQLVTRVRALPLWFRLLLRVALLSLWALGPAAQVTYWLAVGTITEAWPWLLWGGPYLDLAHRMLVEGRPIVFGCLLVLAWWLLGRILNPPPGPRSQGQRVLLAAPRIAWFFVVAACWLTLAPLLAVNAVRAARTFPPRTDRVLQQNCGHCHSPYRPQHYIKSGDMWRRTVRRMIERNGAPVDDKTAERVIAWLTDYRSFPDSWMFRAKCERCHGRQHLTRVERTAEEWDWTVRRATWLSTFGFSVQQTDQIRRYVTAEFAAEPPAEGTPERVALEQRLELQRACNPCHSLSLVLEDGAMNDPRAMVYRMSEKNPELVPPDRVDALTEAVKALPTDEAEFWRLFPHDILLPLD